MTWEVGKEYQTRDKKCRARFIGILDSKNSYKTHIFAVAVKSVLLSGEAIRLTNKDGHYSSSAKEKRPYDILPDEPTAAEKAAIDRVLTAGDKASEVLLEILRENYR